MNCELNMDKIMPLKVPEDANSYMCGQRPNCSQGKLFLRKVCYSSHTQTAWDELDYIYRNHTQHKRTIFDIFWEQAHAQSPFNTFNQSRYPSNLPLFPGPSVDSWAIPIGCYDVYMQVYIQSDVIDSLAYKLNFT